MIRQNILCVGYEPSLLEARAMILRRAGYVVHEIAILEFALSKMESDSIDGVVMCHSIPQKQQQLFVAQIMHIRRLLPILCIKNHPYEQCVLGCTGVDGEPDSLLTALRQAVGQYCIKNDRLANHPAI
jgi:DNA-binding NtrC family response regulator